MKKLISFLVTAIFLITCALSFAACGGNTTTPTKLTMTTPAYSDATKKVTWGAVANASGYKLTFTGQGVNKTETLTATEYTIAEETSGEYSVSIIAKGDGTKYTDSDAKTCTANYTKAASGKTTQQLVMTTPAYSDTTKIVSWDKVANASGYALRVGASNKPSADITESGGKMQYVLSEAVSGNYDVFVKALGSETATHIYTESEEIKVTASYTKPAVTPQQLDAPTLTRVGNSIRWAQVTGAEGYDVTVKLDGITKDNFKNAALTRFYNAGLGLNEFVVNYEQSGSLNFRIAALGDNTATLTSAVAELTYDYTYQPQTGQHATYQQIINVLQPKVEAAIKAQTGMSSATDFRIQTINAKTGEAFVQYNRNGDEYIKIIALGSASNFADFDTTLDYIKNLIIQSATIGSPQNAKSEAETMQVLEAIITNSRAQDYFTQNGITANDVVFAYYGGFTNAGGSTNTTINIFINNGEFVKIECRWSSNVTNISDINGQLGKLNQNGINNFTVLDTQAFTDLASLG